ncbi:MAG: GNAT family protein [Henriciella sp.]|nr:GNAT family protein [Henriciella sp.]
MSLRQRKFTTRDIDELLTWFETERDVLQWAGAHLPYPLQRGHIRELVFQHRGKSPTREVWCLCNDADAMVGHYQLGYSSRLRQATLGRIAINPACRGQGLATKLMSLAIPQAFSQAWVNRLELRVYDFNTPAIVAYTRAGFVHEGTRRQSTPIEDTFWNTHVMSLLREEYNAFDKRTEQE